MSVTKPRRTRTRTTLVIIRPLAAGRWLLAVRWPLAVGRWPLAAGRWPLAVGRWPLAAGRWPLAAGRWPLAADKNGSMYFTLIRYGRAAKRPLICALYQFTRLISDEMLNLIGKARDQCYKTFFFLNLLIFVFPCRPLQTSTVFAGKARSLPLSGAPGLKH